MRVACLIVALGLAGCAASPEQIRIGALQAQDWELCYASLVGRDGYRQAANQVIGERQLDCRQHMQMVQARIAADQASAARSQAQTEDGPADAASSPATAGAAYEPANQLPQLLARHLLANGLRLT